MAFAFKLSRRLAQNFVVGAVTAVVGACGRDSTDPGLLARRIKTITIDPPSASLAVSDSVQFAARLYNAGGVEVSGTVVWWSSATDVAGVSGTGWVRGVASGSATIRASADGVSDSALVVVSQDGDSEPPPPPPPPPPPVRPGFHVSPNGSSSGDGSIDDPLSLTAALAGAGGRIQPGDTVWLHGGTYRGAFRSTLSGTSSQPIVVRGYPGERPIIDGASGSASTWYVGGDYSVFWDFEIINSNPTRVYSSVGDRQNVIANYASYTKYINLVIRDGGVAIYNAASEHNVEITGCIIYNIGWQGSDRGHGHALYLKSNTGPVLARDNIMFNQFGYGIHVFSNPGSGELNNIRLEGNVSFNSGTQSTISTASNILMGGDDYSTGGVLRDNMTYSSPGVANRNVHVGYGSLQNGTVQLADNYFAGGATVLDVGYWNSLSATGNRIMGTNVVVRLNDPSLSLSLFSGQTFSSMPTATKVVVRKSPYETGRANVVVYNWARQGSVSLDLAGIVPQGADFEIHNVQDLFGAPVVTGTYSGGLVELPIRAVTPPPPIGLSSARSPSTGIDFGVYVVSLR